MLNIRRRINICAVAVMLLKCLILFSLTPITFSANSGIATNSDEDYLDEEGVKIAQYKINGTVVEKVCYEEIGCFTMQTPFYRQPDRPIPAPESPETMKSFVDLYTRPDIDKITARVPMHGKFDLRNSTFSAKRNLTIFIMSSGGQNGRWPYRLKSALLEKIDANVFYFNVSVAFRGLQAIQAVGNVRALGVQLARFIKFLEREYKLDPWEQVWLIGYGLGAQLAGYCGEKVPLARITGLDPMQEFFEGYPNEVKLDSTDAKLVDIIHTNSRPFIPDLGFGTMDPTGDVDFYINGGYSQPGCKWPAPRDFTFVGRITDIIERFTAVWTSSIYCHHKRSFDLFVDAVNNADCPIWGHVATTENFLRAISSGGSGGAFLDLTAISEACNLTNCVPIGLNTPKSEIRGIVITTSSNKPPYCNPFDQPERYFGQGLYGYFRRFIFYVLGKGSVAD